MATISFKQNVVVRDPEKIKEVLAAINSDHHDFADIPPADIDYAKEDEYARKWLSHLKKL